MPIVVVVVLSLAIEMQAVRNRNSNRWFWERESVELSNVAVMAAVLLGVCYAGTHLNVRQKLEWLVMECVSAWRWTIPAVIAVPVVVVLELRTQKLRKRSR
jgi:ABC-type proline/glycine betaine transport system permease subunit